MYAASALAANTVCRSACGAVAHLFTQYMFDALGVGGGGSLIGGVAVLLAPIPFVFYKYRGPIRERSKFAPTPQMKDGEGEGEGDRRLRDEEDGGGSLGSSGESLNSSGGDTFVGEGQDRVTKPEDSTEKGLEQTGQNNGEVSEKDAEKGEA